MTIWYCERPQPQPKIGMLKPPRNLLLLAFKLNRRSLGRRLWSSFQISSRKLREDAHSTPWIIASATSLDAWQRYVPHCQQSTFSRNRPLIFFSATSQEKET